MAAAPFIINNPPQTEQDLAVRVITWILTTANPTGVPVSMAEWADKTVEIDGTSNDADLNPAGNPNGQLAWGSVTSVLAIQGSNTGVLGTSLQNPLALSNAAGGAALSGISANKIAAIIENPMFIAPTLTTPGTGATVKVKLILRRNNTMRK